MKYSFLNFNSLHSGSYQILPYREEDIFLIKDWRNQQMEVLRQNAVLTNTDQLNYYNTFVKPSFSQQQPKIILFSYLKNSNCIGYGGLTNVDWHSRRAEISFLVDTSRLREEEQYEEDFLTFLSFMKEVAFDKLQFNRLFAETFAFRTFHIAVLEKAGFKLEGKMKEHVLINNKFTDSFIHGYLRSYYGI